MYQSNIYIVERERERLSFQLYLKARRIGILGRKKKNLKLQEDPSFHPLQDVKDQDFCPKSGKHALKAKNINEGEERKQERKKN